MGTKMPLRDRAPITVPELLDLVAQRDVLRAQVAEAGQLLAAALFYVPHDGDDARDIREGIEDWVTSRAVTIRPGGTLYVKGAP